MQLRNLPLTTAILVAIAAPSAGFADVTNAEVWANYQAYVRAMGGEMTADIKSSGPVLTAGNTAVNFALPMGLGTLSLTSGDMTLTENGDGTVTIRFPAEVELGAVLDLNALGGGTLDMALLSDNYEMLASGVPGDVSYAHDVPRFELVYQNVAPTGALAEKSEMQGFDADLFTGSIRINGSTGTLRVIEGDLVTISSDGSYASMDFEFEFAQDQGDHTFQSTLIGSYGLGTFQSSVSLPADGVPLMALPQALRDGLSFRVSATGNNSGTEQTVRGDGQIFTNVKTTVGKNDFEFVFNSDGLKFSGIAEGYSIEFIDSNIFPFPINAAIDKFTTAIRSPLLAADTPQPFAYQLGLQGVNVGDALWSLIDPQNALPHDPASVNLDITGTFATFIDLLDFMALAALEDSGEIPFDLHELTINDVLLSAAGAELTGSGGFTFDNSNLATFGGMPAPTGVLDLQLVGGNGLMDTLVAMGLLPEDQAMGARMMMGLFAQPGDGDDTLTTRIEVDGATGAVSANGQRLQ